MALRQFLKQHNTYFICADHSKGFLEKGSTFPDTLFFTINYELLEKNWGFFQGISVDGLKNEQKKNL